MSSPLYENRAVAFMDILGMRSIVEKITDDESLRLDLHDCLNHIKNQERYTQIDSSILSHFEVSVFSDCIVISAPPKDLNSLLYVCMNLQNELLMLGIALRGGISIGKLTHQDGLVYGAGLVRAYEIESKEANNPRILLDDALEKTLLQQCFNKLILDIDDDNRVIINPLIHDAYIPGSAGLAAEGIDPRQIFLSEVYKNIVSNIVLAPNDKCRNKWYWLANRLNNVVSEKPCYPEIDSIPIN